MVSLAVGLTLTLLALTLITTAQVPNQMQYQGYLTDDGGSPLDTTVDMEFVIYDDSIGSGTVWTETHLDVIVENGLFEVILGSVSGVTGGAVSDSVRWLGITVGDDSEIYPRTKLVTVPYAFRVGTVDGATGGTISGNVTIQSDLDLDGDLRVTGTVNECRSQYVRVNTNNSGEFLFDDGWYNDTRPDITTTGTAGEIYIDTHGGVAAWIVIKEDGVVVLNNQAYTYTHTASDGKLLEIYVRPYSFVYQWFVHFTGAREGDYIAGLVQGGTD
jgi:hypothetical protein